MSLILMLALSTATAASRPNDVAAELGLSPACFGVCVSYDRRVSKMLALGATLSPGLLFNGGGVYGQLKLHSANKNLFFLEPSAGAIWSLVSRELYCNLGMSVGYERTLAKRRFVSGHLGGGLLSYDLSLSGMDFLPDARVGFGKRF